MIQESLSPYNAVFNTQKCNLRMNNGYFWRTSPENNKIIKGKYFNNSNEAGDIAY